MRPSFDAHVLPSNRAARYDINTRARDRLLKPLIRRVAVVRQALRAA
jgi:hypothetical protein